MNVRGYLHRAEGLGILHLHYSFNPLTTFRAAANHEPQGRQIPSTPARDSFWMQRTVEIKGVVLRPREAEPSSPLKSPILSTSAAEPAPPATQFHYFFDLVPELRSRIISYLCLHPSSINISRVPGSTVPIPVDLFLSHPHIYDLASHIFFTQNAFILDVQQVTSELIGREYYSYYKHYKPSKSRNEPGATITASGNRFKANGRSRTGSSLPLFGLRLSPWTKIRTLEVCIGRFSAFWLDSFAPALEIVLLNGELRNLRVTLSRAAMPDPEDSIWPWRPANAHAPAVAHDDEVLRSPAFTALLKLLADPALESSELVADPRHRTALCRFHPGFECERTNRQRDIFKTRAATVVDWKSIAETYDNQEVLHLLTARKPSSR
jgi:hypothetical protein